MSTRSQQLIVVNLFTNLPKEKDVLKLHADRPSAILHAKAEYKAREWKVVRYATWKKTRAARYHRILMQTKAKWNRFK